MVKKQDQKLQKDLIDYVYQRAGLNGTYILLFILACVITTLGLLVDNTAVVIGGMLIAPLLWPIIGISLSIFRTRRKLAGRAVLTSAASIIVGLVVCALIAFITPIQEVTGEIALRSQPTLLDLFIALAASVIGVVALYYPRISSSAAGVAVSIALLPPLCVSGIGIAFFDWSLFWRSFLLLSTNIVAMIFAGIITLYFLHFRPKKVEGESTFKISVAVSLIILALLAVPLSIYLRDQYLQSQIRANVNTVLQEEVAAIAENARLDEVNVEYVPSFDREVQVQATILLPEGTVVTEADKNSLIQRLADRVEHTVDLQLNVVNTLLLRRQEDEQISQLRRDIEDYISVEVNKINAEAEIDSIEILFPEDFDPDADQELDVKVLIKQLDGIPVTYQEKEVLRVQLEEFINQPAQLQIEFIPVLRLTEPDVNLQLKTKIQNVLFQDFGELDERIELDQVTVTEQEKKGKDSYEVVAQLFIPSNLEVTFFQKEQIQQDLRTETDKDITLTIHVVRYETVVKEEPPEETEVQNEEGVEQF